MSSPSTPNIVEPAPAVADDRVLEALEFPRLLERLAGGAATPMGAALALSVRPSNDVAAIRRDIALTVETVRHLEIRGTLPFGSIVDPRPALARLDIEGSVLAPIEILDLLALMKAGRSVKSFLGEGRAQFPALWNLGRDLPDLGNLIRYLDGKIAASGEIEDGASDELRTVRHEIRRSTERLESILGEILARPGADRLLQDRFISVRGDRHVVPVRAETRASLPGIVHGISGSGATLFVEPLETVDLNNEIVTQRDREAAEIQRLLREYSDLLRSRLPEIRVLAAGIARIDLAVARARLARALDACAPETSPGMALRLETARHPLVESSLRAEGGRIVPLDLDLPAPTPVLVISGPNTGGKTVALKTVGLCAALHQSGLLVPAARALLPVYHRLFIDIGDRQSIADGLSTFSARVRGLATIAADLDSPSLVLLDEIGTGTDPEEGAALAIATLDYLRDRGAAVVATTHLEALKAHAATSPGCANAGMELDEATLRPTYRLVPGIPARSSGIAIAERLGLPGPILEAARARCGSAGRQVADYLARLHAMAADLETRLRETAEQQAALAREREALRAGIERREAELRQALASEIELALGALRTEGEVYLKTIQDRHLAATLRRAETRAAAQLKERARDLIRRARGAGGAPERADLQPGVRVAVQGIGVRGTIESLRGESAVLRVHDRLLTVPIADCRVEEGPGAGSVAPRLPAGVRLTRSPGTRGGDPAEALHLVGRTIDEALPLVDKYLDDAFLAGRSPIRIVHGVGSGRLRRAIGALLSKHPHVESFASAPSDQGGNGVTIVALRS